MYRPAWIFYFIRYFLSARLLGKKAPILAGFKITHECNLKCIHCPFWGRKYNTHATFDEIVTTMRKMHKMGARIIIFEGGEPFLWKQGNKNFQDVVLEARKLFYSVGVSTNGTIPLDCEANAVWVSIDGFEDTHKEIRGTELKEILENIKNSAHKNILANLTINSLNFIEIPRLISFLSGKIKGITIQFHYPYKNDDPLTLEKESRIRVLNNIISLKSSGYPVLDSFKCLDALKENTWKCHDFMLVNAEPDLTISQGCYVKSRGPVSCMLCGFAAHTELSLAFDLHIGPILTGIRAFKYGCS